MTTKKARTEVKKPNNHSDFPLWFEPVSSALTTSDAFNPSPISSYLWLTESDPRVQISRAITFFRKFYIPT